MPATLTWSGKGAGSTHSSSHSYQYACMQKWLQAQHACLLNGATFEHCISLYSCTCHVPLPPSAAGCTTFAKCQHHSTTVYMGGGVLQVVIFTAGRYSPHYTAIRCAGLLQVETKSIPDIACAPPSLSSMMCNFRHGVNSPA